MYTASLQTKINMKRVCMDTHTYKVDMFILFILMGKLAKPNYSLSSYQSAVTVKYTDDTQVVVDNDLQYQLNESLSSQVQEEINL